MFLSVDGKKEEEEEEEEEDKRQEGTDVVQRMVETVALDEGSKSRWLWWNRCMEKLVRKRK